MAIGATLILGAGVVQMGKRRRENSIIAKSLNIATAWEDASCDDVQGRGWTVMGKLRERQDLALRYRAWTDARKKGEPVKTYNGKLNKYAEPIVARAVSPLPLIGLFEKYIKERSHTGPIVVAFLFAHPDSDAIRMLDARGQYFTIRTGETWELFFPGYYFSTKGRNIEKKTGALPVGRRYAQNWHFSPKGFDELREYVERSSERRWEYSGGTDLVLVNGWLPEHGEPTIDWVSTISGQVSDREAGIKTLTLSNVIERITRDLENAIENASYGVGEVTDGPSPPNSHVTRDFMIAALANIAGALGARTLGA